MTGSTALRATLAGGIAFAIGRAVAQWRRTQREVERVFDLSIDLLCVADFDGRFKAVNPAFERTLGYSREELLARPWIDFVHPDDREATLQRFGDVLAGGEVSGFENRYICADGSERWLQWSARPVPEQGVVYSIARDVTERRRFDAELRDAQRTAEARGTELHVRAGEQASLRRVATLVARAIPVSELFDAVTGEAGELLGADFAWMARFEGDAVMPVAVWSAAGPHPAVPESWQMQPGDPATTIAETGAPSRWDDWTDVPGPIAAFVRKELGVRASVGCPIVVEGRLWGALAVHSKQDSPLPEDDESRITQFSDLVATGIANAQARAELARLGDEQAALRRVATLVAQGKAPAEVLTKVPEELANVLGGVDTSLFRDEGDGTATMVAAWGSIVSAGAPVGTRMPLDGNGVIATVVREGRPCRIGDYAGVTGAIVERGRQLGIKSAVGCPVVVRGRVWGALGASRQDDGDLPPETEDRIAQFADLVATAIANAEARSEVERLADEQSALRRVATLVAEGAPATAVFDAVAAEIARLVAADGVTLNRYEPGDEVTVLAHHGSHPKTVPVGTRISHRGENVMTMVRRSERLARMEHRADSQAPVAKLAHTSGVHTSAGAPIVVEGGLWGVAMAHWRGEQPPPPDTGKRIAQFTRLLDTAIANADSRDQLAASRARQVRAGDEARRRVVRDLHDGAQQRLVHTVVSLKLAQRALGEGDAKAEALLEEALEHAEQGNADLRELAHGILPHVLTSGGLRSGVDAVVSRLDLPVRVDVPPKRFPSEIEASAYFIVAEALTNVMKHSRATRAEVRGSVQDDMLQVEVQDDGVGGADPDGHGLVGMADRVTALGGRLTVESPRGHGTLLAATLPLSSS